MEKDKLDFGKNIQVISAQNLEELFYFQKSIRDLYILGAGTTKEHLGNPSEDPKSILFTRTITDLCQIEKKERYIDIGSATSLIHILEIGEKIIPKVFYDALKSIANPFIKNLATIGGNICYTKKRLTLFSPLLALEAGLEFKASASDTLYIPISKFHEVPKGYFLSKIRIPIEDWDISIFKKLGPQETINAFSAFFTFLAQIEKTVVVDVRIAFCGNISFRHKELENKLLGIRLPLSNKFKNELILEAEKLYDLSFEEYQENNTISKTTDALLKQQYLNLLSFSLDYLS